MIDLFEIKNFLDILCKEIKINKELLNKYFIPRIESFIKLAKFFSIERYTQKEWKDLIAIHYINTTYSFDKEAIRVHFFIDKSITIESYLGFITLRNIPEPMVILSYIFPNFPTFIKQYKINFKLKNVRFFIMLYEKNVHISSKELIIKTFPFYSQDGVVTRCAHADIIMVSNYLHHRWNFNKVEISDIINSGV